MTRRATIVALLAATTLLTAAVQPATSAASPPPPTTTPRDESTPAAPSSAAGPTEFSEIVAMASRLIGPSNDLNADLAPLGRLPFELPDLPDMWVTYVSYEANRVIETADLHLEFTTSIPLEDAATYLRAYMATTDFGFDSDGTVTSADGGTVRTINYQRDSVVAEGSGYARASIQFVDGPLPGEDGIEIDLSMVISPDDLLPSWSDWASTVPVLGDHEQLTATLLASLTDNERMRVGVATRFTTTDDWQDIAQRFRSALPSDGFAIVPSTSPDPDFTSLSFLGQPLSYVSFNDVDGPETWINLDVAAIV